MDGETEVSPFKGCFVIRVKPIVMTQKLVDDIGHDCLLGQGFTRLCLGSVDSLNERFDYSPA